jgi:NADPH:quinone reductase-like Zn-dependent oxidoreductase
VVQEVGKGVSKYAPGDRVFGFLDVGAGTQAQYFCYSVEKPLGMIPEGVDFTTAAASLEGAHYAINFINKVKLAPGQKVMLNGATGGIGSVALQILKSMGLTVTATCRQEHMEKIRALGADRVINYEKDDFTLDNEKYDFVFDSVGKSSFGKCRRILKPGGVYISSELGPRGENPFLALITPLLGGKRVIFPFPSNIQKSMDQMIRMLEKGQYTPLIDRVYPMEEAAEAYRYVLKGQKVGNVILDLSGRNG